MVRVGGGWVALDEFLVKNDPCRGMFFVTFLYTLKVQSIKKEIEDAKTSKTRKENGHLTQIISITILNQ